MRVSDQSSQYMLQMKYGAKSQSAAQSARNPAIKNEPADDMLSSAGNTGGKTVQGASGGGKSGIKPPIGRFLDVYV